jgi:hypothetical protein
VLTHNLGSLSPGSCDCCETNLADFSVFELSRIFFIGVLTAFQHTSSRIVYSMRTIIFDLRPTNQRIFDQQLLKTLTAE